LILTGRPFGAKEALELRLVNRVVASDRLLEEAISLAAALAAKPPQTLAAALFAIQHGMDASIDEGLAVEEAAFARIVPTGDASEGIAAFLEKRRPRYAGT
jgi:enoyl-CoA hydratase